MQSMSSSLYARAMSLSENWSGNSTNLFASQIQHITTCARTRQPLVKPGLQCTASPVEGGLCAGTPISCTCKLPATSAPS